VTDERLTVILDLSSHELCQCQCALVVCKTLRPMTMSWLHFFFLSRVSHKGEFYLERFLMR
jgi:hypothetical protein